MTIQALALYAPPALVALAAIIIYVVANRQDREERQTPAE
jgi:hypothetical protein